MKLSFLSLFIFLISASLYAEDRSITFSYWSEAGPPFVFLDKDNTEHIQRGLVKDLAELISTRLHASPRFVNIPVQRTESQLLAGEIDLNCITNPIWKKYADEYFWSPVLFKGADRFLVDTTKSITLDNFSDLKGKSLAIYKGYTYHPTIMAMIKAGDINAVKVSGIDHGIQLLQLGRIDALIDFDIILEYKIKNENLETFALAGLYAEKYDLFCAYSKKSRFDKIEIDNAFNELLNNGEIQNILDRYN